MNPSSAELPVWRQTLHTVIFEAETPGGRAFDIALLVAIASSLVAVSLETVGSIRARYGAELRGVEWGFTAAFTLEYLHMKLSQSSEQGLFERLVMLACNTTSHVSLTYHT